MGYVIFQLIQEKSKTMLHTTSKPKDGRKPHYYEKQTNDISSPLELVQNINSKDPKPLTITPTYALQREV